MSYGFLFHVYIRKRAHSNRLEREGTLFFFFAFNQSNLQSNSFYQVPKFVYHKEEKCKKLSEKRRAKKLLTLHLQTGGVESDDARVCSDQLPYVALFI